MTTCQNFIAELRLVLLYEMIYAESGIWNAGHATDEISRPPSARLTFEKAVLVNIELMLSLAYVTEC